VCSLTPVVPKVLARKRGLDQMNAIGSGGAVHVEALNPRNSLRSGTSPRYVSILRGSMADR
jgi:hypothetical protein